jgi:hypothetical protein
LSFVVFLLAVFFFAFFCLFSFALLFFNYSRRERIGQSQAELALCAGAQSEAGRNATCGKVPTCVAPCGAVFLLRTAQDGTSQAAE